MGENRTPPLKDRAAPVHRQDCPVACGWWHAGTDRAAQARRIQQHMRDRHQEGVTSHIGLHAMNQPLAAISPARPYNKPTPADATDPGKYPPPPYPPKGAEWIGGYRQGMAHCLDTLQPLLDADASINAIRQAVRSLRGQMPEPAATPPS